MGSRTQRGARRHVASALAVAMVMVASGLAVAPQVEPVAAAGCAPDFDDVAPDAFALLLIGKDGGEKRRDTSVPDLNSLFNLIDGMPMRQAEMDHDSGSDADDDGR